jgi:3-deoxy-manno-octulosonate cytidylyltransferase (CMP-KDO synthetase)
MVVRVAQAAQRSAADHVIVATDSEEVLNAARSFGVDALITSREHVSGTDRIAEAAQRLGVAPDDAVINVQGDEPLIEASLIDALLGLLRAHPDCPMVTAAHPLEETLAWTNPNVVKVVLSRCGNALYFSRALIPHDRDSRRSSEDEAVLRHVGVYGYRMHFLARYGQLERPSIERLESLEQLRALWHGHRIHVHRLDQPAAPGVDTPHDLAVVRELFLAHPKVGLDG